MPQQHSAATVSRIPLKASEKHPPIHGSITHGTPLPGQMLATPSSQSSRYDGMISKQSSVSTREGGSITQGTPILQDQNRLSIAVKDGGVTYEPRPGAGIEIIPRSGGYQRSDYRGHPTSRPPNVSTASGYPYNASSYYPSSRPSYPNQLDDKRSIIVEADFMTSQQMIRRGGVPAETEVHVSSRAMTSRDPSPQTDPRTDPRLMSSQLDRRNLPRPIDPRILDQQHRLGVQHLELRHEPPSRSEQHHRGGEYQLVEVHSNEHPRSNEHQRSNEHPRSNDQQQARGVPLPYPSYGSAGFHLKPGENRQPAASPVAVRDATLTPPTSEMSHHSSEYHSMAHNPNHIPGSRVRTVINRPSGGKGVPPSSQVHYFPPKNLSPRGTPHHLQPPEFRPPRSEAQKIHQKEASMLDPRQHQMLYSPRDERSSRTSSSATHHAIHKSPDRSHEQASQSYMNNSIKASSLISQIVSSQLVKPTDDDGRIPQGLPRTILAEAGDKRIVQIHPNITTKNPQSNNLSTPEKNIVTVDDGPEVTRNNQPQRSETLKSHVDTVINQHYKPKPVKDSNNRHVPYARPPLPSPQGQQSTPYDTWKYNNRNRDIVPGYSPSHEPRLMEQSRSNHRISQAQAHFPHSGSVHPSSMASLEPSNDRNIIRIGQAQAQIGQPSRNSPHAGSQMVPTSSHHTINNSEHVEPNILSFDYVRVRLTQAMRSSEKEGGPPSVGAPNALSPNDVARRHHPDDQRHSSRAPTPQQQAEEIAKKQQQQQQSTPSRPHSREGEGNHHPHQFHQIPHSQNSLSHPQNSLPHSQNSLSHPQNSLPHSQNSLPPHSQNPHSQQNSLPHSQIPTSAHFPNYAYRPRPPPTAVHHRNSPLPAVTSNGVVVNHDSPITANHHGYHATKERPTSNYELGVVEDVSDDD